MAQTVSVKVEGLQQLHRALKNYNNDLKKELEKELLEAGQLVANSAREKFAGIDSRSAAGFRPRVRGFGKVVVQQRRSKTTGQHPDFGSLQMKRALLPALYEEEDAVLNAVENMLDRLGRSNGF